MTNKQAFLLELADLIDKHDVAICSQNTGTCSEVLFQFKIDNGKKLSFENLRTGRLHSTGYELRSIANDPVRLAK